MLEKPELEDEKIITCLRDEYGLHVEAISFLPLGADRNTAVYRAVTNDHSAYFVKLRRGDFIEASVSVPKYLSDLGIRQIIPPLLTQSGKLWASLDAYRVILYPFVEGRNGFEVALSERQRVEFGAALKRFHSADIPAALTGTLPREDFSPRWRDALRRSLTRIECESFTDPLASELAAFLKTRRAELAMLVDRAERYALALRTQPLEWVVCHADIHAWNLLIDEQGALYIVDWDTLMLAPKERDLMFVGCGLGGRGCTPQEEATLFYQGYGATEINPLAVAYYRYERIIEDIALFCEQILSSEGEGDDRKQALEFLKSNFLPDGLLDRACRLDQNLF